MTISLFFWIRRTTSAYTSASFVELPSGSLTCIWAMEAPAFAASMAESAISRGVYGTWGVWALVVSPHSATVIIIFLAPVILVISGLNL